MTKCVDWSLMGGLLHLIQRGGYWARPQPAQAPPRCTKCNSPPISQCTKYQSPYCCINGPLLCDFNVPNLMVTPRLTTTPMTTPSSSTSHGSFYDNGCLQIAYLFDFKSLCSSAYGALQNMFMIWRHEPMAEKRAGLINRPQFKKIFFLNKFVIFVHINRLSLIKKDLHGLYEWSLLVRSPWSRRTCFIIKSIGLHHTPLLMT